LRLQYDQLLSKFAFNFNLRPYIMASLEAAGLWYGGAGSIVETHVESARK
jgi:hypothetical protein